jgi:citrate lyase subunit beta/citryl-CoA lyase
MSDRKIRRTLMYVPGNNAGLIVGSSVYEPDVLVYDLEDSVIMSEKDSARELVSSAIKNRDFLNIRARELMVRVNSVDSPYFRDDIFKLVTSEYHPDSIRLPKVESPEDVQIADRLLSEAEFNAGIAPGTIEIIAILESVAGVFRVDEIACSCPRLTGLTLGAEDFTKDLGTSRSKSGDELDLARKKIVLAAAYAGIDAMDTVFSDISDPEALKTETQRIKDLGFTGKSVIHPSQISIVNDVFAPSQKEIDQALRIIDAAEEAEKKGAGAVALDGKMVDPPVVTRAVNLIKKARALGLSEENTSGTHENQINKDNDTGREV